MAFPQRKRGESDKLSGQHGMSASKLSSYARQLREKQSKQYGESSSVDSLHSQSRQKEFTKTKATLCADARATIRQRDLCCFARKIENAARQPVSTVMLR
jgi:hypothetical protein